MPRQPGTERYFPVDALETLGCLLSFPLSSYGIEFMLYSIEGHQLSCTFRGLVRDHTWGGLALHLDVRMPSSCGDFLPAVPLLFMPGRPICVYDWNLRQEIAFSTPLTINEGLVELFTGRVA